LKTYLNLIEKKLPWYVDELRGLADGSQVPFEQV
jgi:hypothetical protein